MGIIGASSKLPTVENQDGKSSRVRMDPREKLEKAVWISEII